MLEKNKKEFLKKYAAKLRKYAVHGENAKKVCGEKSKKGAKPEQRKIIPRGSL